MYALHDLATLTCIEVELALVSSPDPAPKREEGLVYIECFLGLVCVSDAPIRFVPCGLDVIIM